MKKYNFIWKSLESRGITKVVQFLTLVVITLFIWFYSFLPTKERFVFFRQNLTNDSNLTKQYEYQKKNGDNVFMVDARKGYDKLKTLMVMSRSKYIYLDQASFVSKLLPKKIVTTNLWHGYTAIKSIGLSGKGPKAEKHRSIGTYGVQDLSICSSELFKENVSKSIGIEEKDIIVTRLPRSLSPKINNGTGVLFAPTYRVNDDGGHFYPKEIQPIEDLRFLGKNLFVKYHPSTKGVRVPEWATDASKMSVTDCISKTNILISDFSGFIIDYCLLSKKSNYISYIPDINNYSSKVGLAPTFKYVISDQTAETKLELIKAIKNPSFTNYDLIKKLNLEMNEDTCEVIRQRTINFKK